MNQSKLETLQLHQEFVKSLAEVRYVPYYSVELLLKQHSGVKLPWNFQPQI